MSIVHIPVHLAQNYTNQLYWTLERARECEFFNLTANRIEVSLPNAQKRVDDRGKHEQQSV